MERAGHAAAGRILHADHVVAAGDLSQRIDGAVEQKLGVKARRLEAVAGSTLDAIREMGSLFASASGGKR